MPACSLNRSLTTLSLPLSRAVSLPSKPSFHQIQQSPSLCFTHTIAQHSSNLAVSDDSSTIAAMVEAVSLANAAAEAAKDAVSSALVLKELCIGEDGCLSESAGVAARRRRRMRKMKKSSAFYDNSDDVADAGRGIIKGCSDRSRYLTRREETEFSLHLKVGAMLDDSDSRCPTTAAGIGRRGRADKACLRARECRERISLSYKRLVVSIATPYQGKGLTLQDLIQVDSVFL